MRDLKSNGKPKWAEWLASKFIDEFFLEEFLGDLEEIYEDRIQSKGKTHARMMYWIDALHLLFGFTSFLKVQTQNTNIMMIQNMFKIAWRSALRQKQFTILNILGLTLGIGASVMIGLYISDETSYDSFHDKGSRIYRINQPEIWEDWDKQSASTGPNVGLAIKEEAPEFEEVTRLMELGYQITKFEGEDKKMATFKEAAAFAAEPNFFDVFSFELLQGDPQTVLVEPLSMVLTQETAERYFGFEEAIGKNLEVKQYDGSWKTFTVRGIVADIPHQSHIQFDMLSSFSSHKESLQREKWLWIFTAFSTYGLVHEGTDVATLEEKLQAIPPKRAPRTTETIFNQSFEEFTAGHLWRLSMQPLSEIYLSEEPSFHRFGPTGNPQFVYIFGVVGVLVLLLSCINFMNLSTAKSSNRAKEVGIRKVLGSNKRSLIIQFVFESILYVAVSTTCALILVQYFLAPFNSMADKQLELMPLFMEPSFLFIIGTFILTLGVLAGSYPAFYLSSFRPIETLKGKASNGFNGKGIRNGLIVFQFTISIALIICTFFVQKQLSHASTMDLGFKKDNILQIHNIEQLGFDTDVLKNKLLSNPAFTKVGKSFGIPPNVWSGDRYSAFGPDQPVVQLKNLRTEEDYVDLLGLNFLAGRNFDPSKSMDKYSVLLNESAVALLGWGTPDQYAGDSPIGKFLKIASGDEDKMEVIGVVQDFNFNSVREKIDPLVIIHHQNNNVWDYGAGLSFYSIRLDAVLLKNSIDLQLLIEEAENMMAELDPSIPFEYSFMDQDFDNTFRAEQRMGSALNAFTFMAVVIACLGLFGLAAFSAEQRIKELGIRKVLGASVSQLVLLFSSEFTKLIGFSVLIAVPVSYLAVQDWLSRFAFRTTIDVWVFVTAGLVSLSIALLTIGYQSLTAAHRNPVDALKDE